MTKDFVRQVLKEHIESNRPTTPNLWPPLRNRLQQTPHPVHQPRRSRVSFGPRPIFLLAAMAVALLALAALTSAMLTVAQPAPVSAAELLTRVEQATAPDSPSRLRSFHGVLVGEQRNSSPEEFKSLRQEQWFVAPHSYRSEARIRARNGEESTLMWVSNGQRGWKYDSTIGQAEQLSGKQLKISLTFSSVQGLLVGPMGKLYNAEVKGTEQVNGRTAYIVEMTLKPADQWPPNMSPSRVARSTLWVDSHSYFILRSQSWDSEGTLLSTYEYESFEIDAPIDPNIFNAPPPSR